MPALFSNFYKGRKIFITGHTGFKGSWLSIWLNKLGADVIGYALPPPTHPSLFDICKLKEKVTSIEGDVRDYNLLKNTVENHQPEIIFHMAAQSLVRYSYVKPIETYETNVMGTVNVFEACRHSQSVKVIVNVTSDKCYEDRHLKYGYKECDRMGGYDPYSSSKGCAELITAAYRQSFFNPTNKNNRVSVASVRAGNVIGGGDWSEDRLVPDCIKALIKSKPILIRNPDAVRPWQHVLEPLYGYLLLAKSLYRDCLAFSGAWNFGPHKSDAKPVKWIVERILRLWGGKYIWRIDKGLHPHESSCLKLNSNKAKSKLGWQPNWNLDKALIHTVAWYKSFFEKEDMFSITMKQIENYENTLIE